MPSKSHKKWVRRVENRRDSTIECASISVLFVHFSLVAGFRPVFRAGVVAEYRSDGQFFE